MNRGEDTRFISVVRVKAQPEVEEDRACASTSDTLPPESMANTPAEKERSSSPFQMRWVRRLPFVPMYSDPWPKRRRKYLLSFFAIAPLLVLLGWILGVRFGFGNHPSNPSTDQRTDSPIPTARTAPDGSIPKIIAASAGLSATITPPTAAPSALASAELPAIAKHPRRPPLPASRNRDRQPEASPLPQTSAPSRARDPGGERPLVHTEF